MATFEVYVDVRPDVWLNKSGYLVPYAASDSWDECVEGKRVHIMEVIGQLLKDYRSYKTDEYDSEMRDIKESGHLDWMLETAEFLTEKYKEI